VRAVCSDKLHVRFGGEGLVFLDNQDLASYPTSTARGNARDTGKGNRWYGSGRVRDAKCGEPNRKATRS